MSRSHSDSLELGLYDFEKKEDRVLLGDKNYIQGQFSPDGRWIAYASDESGQGQVYVQDFPGLRQRWQISGSGGVFPQWGKGSIIYRAGDRTVRRVDVKPGAGGLAIGKEQVLFASTISGDRSIQMALTPGDDGLWTLVLAESDASKESPPIRFVLNWRGNR